MHKRRFKLKIKKYKMKDSDRNFMVESYKHIRTMNKLASKSPKDLREIYTKEIAEIRSQVTYSYATSFFEVTLSLGPHNSQTVFSHYPEKSNIVSMKTELLARISKGRVESRERHTVKREFQGMRYNMTAPPITTKNKNIIEENGLLIDTRTWKPVTMEIPKIFPSFKGGGAVFEKPGSIIELLKGEEYKQRIRRAKKPYDKANYVGVELELIAKVGRERLDQLFIEAQLAGSVYVKTDGSIKLENRETDIPHEITLIAKESRINEIIKRVCAVLTSKEVGAYVNNSCGLHVHLDMRSRDVDTCYGNIYNSLNILGKMVPADRTDTDHGKRYCALICSDTFKGAIQEGIRYKALNAMSYQSHKTLEIRLHSGTINAEKINQWCNILMAIVKPGELKGKIDTVEDMQAMFGLHDDTVDYIKLRTKKFENRNLDTRQDHFEATA